MISSLLIGQRKIAKTMILSFWPCNVRVVGALMAPLSFQFAGVQQRIGDTVPNAHDPATRVSRKQLLAALEAGTYADFPEVWFLLHKQEQAPSTPLASPTGGLAVHLNRGLANFFVPPRRSLVERVLAALVARGQTLTADDPLKTEALVRRVGRLRPNEALAAHWIDDRLFVRAIRRDDIDSRNIGALIASAPAFDYGKDPKTSPWAVHRFLTAEPPPAKAEKTS